MGKDRNKRKNKGKGTEGRGKMGRDGINRKDKGKGSEGRVGRMDEKQGYLVQRGDKYTVTGFGCTPFI